LLKVKKRWDRSLGVFPLSRFPAFRFSEDKRFKTLPRVSLARSGILNTDAISKWNQICYHLRMDLEKPRTHSLPALSLSGFSPIPRPALDHRPSTIDHRPSTIASSRIKLNQVESG